ncbi:hypothetical protein BDF14DRAFT_1842675 [Spinellus fusiger]|nr:hypothetical protein BDF14DRAFT_1842675 [Spinellus fusiger]
MKNSRQCGWQVFIFKQKRTKRNFISYLLNQNHQSNADYNNILERKEFLKEQLPSYLL